MEKYKKVCPKGHKLKYGICIDHCGECDICEYDIQVNEKSYFCKECDFDICDKEHNNNQIIQAYNSNKPVADSNKSVDESNEPVAESNEHVDDSNKPVADSNELK